jgi:hypothetical protein
MVTAARTRGRPFAPNTSGNPAGRPKGARNRVTVTLERIMEGDALEIVAAVLAQAKTGDLTAARLILDRVAPVPRDRRISLDLPAADTADGVDKAVCAVIAAVADGTLLLSEAVALSGLLDMRRKSIESREFESRLIALESVK